MSDIDEKNIEKVESHDNVARAKLKHHLSYRGYIVKESDEIGPLKVIVNGMSLQEWERDSVDVQKGGRGKGKVKDFWMRLVSETGWKYH